MKIAFLASRSHAARDALAMLSGAAGTTAPGDADVIVPLGGDGFMLDVLHETADLGVPVYGMNRGTVGFLMNAFGAEDLESRITAALPQVIHPLKLVATGRDGRTHVAHAINEVSILRQGPQAANLRIEVDGRERMENLMCDGVMLATPAGSTAYNYSAYGPILPIGANVLALTPIAAFRPRRWRGAVVPDTAQVCFEAADPVKRPVMVNADSLAFRDIIRVEIAVDRSRAHCLLFDPGHSLEERILREQFT